MSGDAADHRRFRLSTSRALRWDYEHVAKAHDAFEHAGLRGAYTFAGRRLVPALIVAKKAQEAEFAKYATPWETRWSKLVPGNHGHGADPVVDCDGNVVGHLGRFNGRDVCFARRSDAGPPMVRAAAALRAGIGALGRAVGLTPSRGSPPGAAAGAAEGAYYAENSANEYVKDKINRGIPVYVCDDRIVDNLREYYWNYASEESYTLLVDIGGRVLWPLGHDVVGLESEAVTPLDLVLVTKLAVDVGAYAGRKVVGTLARWAFRREGKILAKRELSQGLADVLEAESAGQTVPGTPPLRESAGAAGPMGQSPRVTPAVTEAERMGFLEPGSHQGVSATAKTARSQTTSIRADLGEISGYKARLERGEIGLERPQGANRPGPDYITAARGADGKMWININDAKARVRASSSFGRTKSALPETWKEAVDDAVSPLRLRLRDPKLEAEIREAWRQGRFRIRRDTIDFSPTRQARVRLDTR